MKNTRIYDHNIRLEPINMTNDEQFLNKIVVNAVLFLIIILCESIVEAPGNQCYRDAFGKKESAF